VTITVNMEREMGKVFEGKEFTWSIDACKRVKGI
jgi:hypothetical protein